MRAHHDVPMARQVAAEIDAAVCRGRGRWWSRKEAAHSVAPDRASAMKAAAPALRLCGRCESYELCEVWAQLDRYTGLAAGAAYLKGERRDPARVHRQSIPPHQRPAKEPSESTPDQADEPGEATKAS